MAGTNLRVECGQESWDIKPGQTVQMDPRREYPQLAYLEDGGLVFQETAYGFPYEISPDRLDGAQIQPNYWPPALISIAEVPADSDVTGV